MGRESMMLIDDLILGKRNLLMEKEYLSFFKRWNKRRVLFVK
jgi:hypothetical protein